MKRAFSAFLVFAVLGFSTPVSAETALCTPITVVGTVIDSPGLYCLAGNLVSDRSSGFAIEVRVDDVTIDLNGWVLDGSAAPISSTEIGIRAYERQRVTVRNGSVRGFYVGVQISGGSGHLVEGLLVDTNRLGGILVEGIAGGPVSGAASTVRSNRVLNTGGSTSTYSPAWGIRASGVGVQVIDNQVINTFVTGYGSGTSIYVAGNGAVVHGNRLSNPALIATGGATGVWINGSSTVTSHDVAVTNNTVARMTYGVVYQLTYATGLYANNLVMGCKTAFSGGTPAGTTNFVK